MQRELLVEHWTAQLSNASCSSRRAKLSEEADEFSFGISAGVLEDLLPMILVTECLPLLSLVGSKYRCNGDMPLLLAVIKLHRWLDSFCRKVKDSCVLNI
jgi:hypothetical protein